MHILRLDEADPAAAWRARVDALVERRRAARRARASTRSASAAPGTDLRVGLLPSSQLDWRRASRPSTGIAHMPNLPTEEVFTAPDPQRVDGEVRATKPLVCSAGPTIEGLRVRFEGGRAVAIDGRHRRRGAARR